VGNKLRQASSAFAYGWIPVFVEMTANLNPYENVSIWIRVWGYRLDVQQEARMKGFLLIAHGSKKTESKEEIIRLTQTLREMLEGQYDLVSAAFLQQASPSAPEKMQEFIDRGITEILIVPYLLATGQHVARDIPQMVEETRNRHPELAIRITPHIGAATGMPGLILKHIEEAK